MHRFWFKLFVNCEEVMLFVQLTLPGQLHSQETDVLVALLKGFVVLFELCIDARFFLFAQLTL